jgi:hypothetical protein
MGSARSNGALDANSLDLSNKGTSCFYHATIPANMTDIVLVITSDETIDSDQVGYSITVSAHATIAEHIEEQTTLVRNAIAIPAHDALEFFTATLTLNEESTVLKLLRVRWDAAISSDESQLGDL